MERAMIPPNPALAESHKELNRIEKFFVVSGYWICYNLNICEAPLAGGSLLWSA
jgi:hypothetical protein